MTADVDAAAPGVQAQQPSAGLDELHTLWKSLPPLGPWIEDAACAALGEGAAIWTADHPDVEELAVAEAVCWRCEVRQECADYASQAPVFGLWGATWHGTKAGRLRAA